MSAAGTYDGERLPNLLEEVLADQQQLSAVDVFARRHDAGELAPRSMRYEERMPLGRTPGAGEQLAFRVDLDACTGCKACVTACHSLNGLAPEETWRDVGLLVGEGPGAGLQQTITTACHHCEDPGCLAGCPVQAYEKDPVTGIVRHLDDQCIGCQYCVLKCPYDVPKYSASLGIVRKCDMCAGRLAEGEAPACVQGCPNGAIAIEIVAHSGDGPARALLPTARALPDSSYTRPTTRYVSASSEPRLRPADLERVRPAAAHDPLAIMLVLVQLSVGLLLVGGVAASALLPMPFLRSSSLVLAALCAAAGLGAATLHLGRPLLAFRAFLGWRTSWMSREILVFGAYVPLLVLTAALSTSVDLGLLPPSMAGDVGAVLPMLLAATSAFGVLGTLCSIMIYVDTRRGAWALARTAPAFVGTLLGLGALGTAVAAGVAAVAAGAELPRGAVASATLLGLCVLGLKLAWEARLSTRRAGPGDALSRTALLLRGELRPRVRLRFGLAALGGALAIAGPSVFGGGAAFLLAAATALVCFALGEFVERHLYFTSEASPGMPGH